MLHKIQPVMFHAHYCVYKTIKCQNDWMGCSPASPLNHVCHHMDKKNSQTCLHYISKLLLCYVCLSQLKDVTLDPWLYTGHEQSLEKDT